MDGVSSIGTTASSVKRKTREEESDGFGDNDSVPYYFQI